MSAVKNNYTLFDQYPLVAIEWSDCLVDKAEWSDVDHVTLTVPKCVSVGWLIKTTKSTYVLCSDVHHYQDEGRSKHHLLIPKRSTHRVIFF